MTAAVWGLGLIGGSMALALRDNALADRIVGVDASPENAAKALELGLVDETVDADEATKPTSEALRADLIILATPVDATPVLAVKALNKARPEQVIMDVGSIKEELCEVIEKHPARGRFVATHPMWGTEFSGPEAARKGAFAGRTAVICDREKSDPDALATVEALYETLGAQVIHMSAAEQDMHAAYVSHISHITSFALALTVLEKEREQERIFDLAGGGFESTVRLAKSSPNTWVPILAGNKYNVLDVLREHIHQLNIMKKILERDDLPALHAAISKANEIKKILP